jgi:hypothetical protein
MPTATNQGFFLCRAGSRRWCERNLRQSYARLGSCHIRLVSRSSAFGLLRLSNFPFVTFITKVAQVQSGIVWMLRRPLWMLLVAFLEDRGAAHTTPNGAPTTVALAFLMLGGKGDFSCTNYLREAGQP